MFWVGPHKKRKAPHFSNSGYPLPNIQDALDGFAGATVFSTLDLAAGFHQIVLDESSRHLTAFRTDQGLYEYNVMPMGLANAPAMCND